MAVKAADIKNIIATITPDPGSPGVYTASDFSVAVFVDWAFSSVGMGLPSVYAGSGVSLSVDQKMSRSSVSS